MFKSISKTLIVTCFAMLFIASAFAVAPAENSAVQAIDSSNCTDARRNQVQKSYIAFYQRPGDPAGVDWWCGKLAAVNGNLSEIIDAFVGEVEFTERFGSLSNSELVEKLYQGILGRPSDAAGREWYTGQLDTQKSTLATIGLDLLGGAKNEDALTVANRLDFAKSFTQMIADSLVQYGPTQIQAAFDLMATITDDGAFLSTALGGINDLVLSFPAIGVPPTDVGDGEWNLTISGTVTSLGVAVAIGDIVIEGLNGDEVPDAGNVTAVENSIEQLYSEAGFISGLTITIDSNGGSLVVLTTSFSATASGVGLTYDLTYTYEKQ